MPIVSPANDDNLYREMLLFEWWEKYPRGKEGVFLFRVHAVHSCRERKHTLEEMGFKFSPLHPFVKEARARRRA